MSIRQSLTDLVRRRAETDFERRPTLAIPSQTDLSACTLHQAVSRERTSYSRKFHYEGEKARRYDAGRAGPDSAPIARHRWDQEMSAVERIADALPGGTTVLDLPCGTGRFFPIFTRRGHRVFGGDVSRDMLAAVPNSRRGSGGVLRLRCEAERIPLPDQSVDTVLAMRFWSFLPDAVRRQVLAEWRRVARRGVYVQVRFRAEVGAPTCFSRFRSPQSMDVDEGVTPRQRGLWPTLSDFAGMTARAGFAITATIALDWGPVTDPVIICQLAPL